MAPKSLTEKGVFSGMFPAWRSPRVSDTSPTVVPNLMSVDPMSALADVVPKSAVTKRHVSSVAINLCGGRSESRHCDPGGAISEVVALTEAMIVVEVVVDCFPWFSEKPCLFIATSDESLSVALILDFFPVGFVVVIVGGAAVVAVDVVAAPGVLGVCAWFPLVLLLLLWLFSLSSVFSASLSSCWYISSTMGFHNRTLALMNQFDT